LTALHFYTALCRSIIMPRLKKSERVDVIWVDITVLDSARIKYKLMRFVVYF
jgi:hypothetical protein